MIREDQVPDAVWDWAERCARCHSSKQPDKAITDFFPPGSIGSDYRTHWDRYWCPDFVVNRGHYFGTDFLPDEEGEPGLSDEDKRALLEFLKTF